MKQVNIIGNIFSGDGYASHTISLARALKAEGASVSIETQLFNGWESMISDDLREMVELKQPLAATVFIGLPDFWIQKLSERPKKFFGFFVWECNEVPECYKKVMRDSRIDGILVPSVFSKKVLEREGIHNVFVVPHGVNSELFRPEVKDDGVFTFVFNKGWSDGVNDRSGLDLLLKAFSEEFSKSDKVKLFIKINAVYNRPGWNLQDEISKLGLNFSDAAPIQLSLDRLEPEQLKNVYNSADVFVVPSKGEAFGLTFIEAMACAKPCIATNFGGQTDFINEDNGWLIDYDLVPATAGFIAEGCFWALPRVAHLRKLLRAAFSASKAEMAVKQRLSLETARQYSWSKSAKALLELV